MMKLHKRHATPLKGSRFDLAGVRTFVSETLKHAAFFSIENTGTLWPLSRIRTDIRGCSDTCFTKARGDSSDQAQCSPAAPGRASHLQVLTENPQSMHERSRTRTRNVSCRLPLHDSSPRSYRTGQPWQRRHSNGTRNGKVLGTWRQLLQGHVH